MILTGVAQPLAVEFTRRFAAPRGLIFDMWTRPELISNWCRPKISTLLDSEFDIRPGGYWLMTLQYPNGTIAKVGGGYREIVPPSRLSFTWSWERGGRREDESFVTVDFIAQGQSTLVHLCHTRLHSEAERDGRGQDWSTLFQDLDQVVSGKTPSN